MPSNFVSLRIPEDLLEHARALAELEDRSISSVIRQAVRAHVEPVRPMSTQTIKETNQ